MSWTWILHGSAFQSGEGCSAYLDVLPAGPKAAARRGGVCGAPVLMSPRLEWEEEEGVGRLFLSFPVAGRVSLLIKYYFPMNWHESVSP